MNELCLQAHRYCLRTLPIFAANARLTNKIASVSATFEMITSPGTEDRINSRAEVRHEGISVPISA
jgi:hypothetical protein